MIYVSKTLGTHLMIKVFDKIRKRFSAEFVFNKALFFSAICTALLIIATFITLLIESLPSLKKFGLKFAFSQTWDPIANEFGALPFIAGTLLTSFIAVIIAVVFSIAIAIFLGEYFRKGFLSTFISSMIELLAGIPSVIYGFWGLFVLVPVVREIEMKFNIPPFGIGIATASVILSIMIIPYSASVAREVITLVPNDIKEAAYSLGATRYEVIRKIIVPYVRSGIFAGILLALGRAIGETMAVTMVIGNSNFIPKDIFGPGNTMASIIANEFAEASGELYVSSLVEIALLLLIITLIINMAGKYIINKMSI